MHFDFTAEQRDLSAGLDEMLHREFTAEALRAVWDGGSGHDAVLWRRLAEMGVLGLLVAETEGGFGGDFVDAILPIEALGRAAVPGPVLETMVVGALAFVGRPEAGRIASGELRITAALAGERHIPHRADVVLLRDAHGVLAVGGEGLRTVAGIDGGRVLTELQEATDGGSRVASDADALFDAGALAAAAYLIGLSSRVLSIAADYARARRQFGQPIGSFQAVKHLLADALLKVEFARPAVYRAAWSHAAGGADRTRDVSMAKALASDAARQAARSALQVHGAIGYTWECDLHLYMKKAWALAPAWGSAAWHRRRVADAVLGPRPFR